MSIRKVPIDSIRFEGCGLDFSYDGDRALFSYPTEEGVARVAVQVNGRDLVFFPRRSAGQRDVLRKLGL